MRVSIRQACALDSGGALQADEGWWRGLPEIGTERSPDHGANERSLLHEKLLQAVRPDSGSSRLTTYCSARRAREYEAKETRPWQAGPSVFTTLPPDAVKERKRGAASVQEKPEQNDDGDGDAQQPEQNTAKHLSDLLVVDFPK